MRKLELDEYILARMAEVLEIPLGTLTDAYYEACEPAPYTKADFAEEFPLEDR